VVAAWAASPRDESCAAQLGYRRVDRECAAEVPREPDVHHLASLAACCPPRARAVPTWRQTAFVATSAHTVGVPTRDRTAGCGPPKPARHAEHDPDQHEWSAGDIGIDQSLRPSGVEINGVVLVLAVLGMDPKHSRAWSSATWAPGREARSGGAPALPPACCFADRRTQSLCPNALLRRRECDRRILMQPRCGTADRLRRQLAAAVSTRSRVGRRREGHTGGDSAVCDCAGHGPASRCHNSSNSRPTSSR
jgi:hypothetical protein